MTKVKTIFVYSYEYQFGDNRINDFIKNKKVISIQTHSLYKDYDNSTTLVYTIVYEE